MTNDLLETLRRHKLWVKGDADGRCADLTGAKLTGINLRHAKLTGAILPVFCIWKVGYSEGRVHIGGEAKTIAEWDAWFAGAEDLGIPRGTEEFKRIRANYLAVKAYVEAMK